MSSKLRDLTAIFLIQLVLTLPFYTANAYGLAISNVRVTKEASNSATIEWATDNISNGRVRYGKTTSLGFTQRHDNFIGNHTISVFNGIDSSTTYFFSVESTDLAGSTAVDNNSNSFYTFRTTDITPPPQVTGLKALSATSGSIFLSWDSLTISDLSHYVIYRDRIPIANSTASSFNDTNLNSAAQHSYKVSAVDSSGNEGPLSDTVIASTAAIDSTAPAISSVDVLAITDAASRVTWLTDENSTSEVFYGINKTDKAKSSGDLVTNHSIVIDGLTKNTIFVFAVRSCDSSNNCANSSLQSFTAGRDTTAPFINLSIPRFVNRRVIDITGSTEPFSSVTLFVNNMNIPKRSLSNNEVGSSGKFIFSQVQLEQDNIIKIVIVDKSGNKNQKIFEVSVDAEDPTVKLDEIPSLTSKTNVTISGTVNEPVAIKVFVDADTNKSSAPLQITGLNATKIGQNSVELHWDESSDKDFSHYVVYRADSSPIAITKPANFNLFIDALVDSGKSYTYQISAVDIFANEGPKSEPVTATTLRGGAILNLRPADVDIFEDFRKPLLVVNATGAFNFGVRLNNGDGNYRIKLIFEDRAGNTVVFDRSVTLDTKKPDVKILSPASGSLIFENVANEIDVTGKTKPNARVHLFVDRTPFSFFNNSLQLSGLPNEIQDLPEAKLDAKCRLSVSASFCKTGADFSVSADSQGNFKFDRVDLTAIFGGATRIREVPVTEFRDTVLNPESQQSKKTTLVVIATDQAGQRGVASQTVNIGTCWSGNQSWDIIPLTQYQSPAFLSTERMAEGTETAYFYFNYSYIGRGNNAKITNVALSKACGTRELLDPRFNISCQIVSSGNQPVRLNKEGTLSYSAVVLSRFPGMDHFLENDWKGFLKAINNEFTLPFKVQITYEHEVQDENGAFNKVKEVQTTCEQVSYAVDNSIIDPRKVLPDWLLYGFVDFLQDSIKTLNELQKNVNQLLDYAAIGCTSSIYLTVFVQIYRRLVVFWDEKAYTIVKNIRDIAKFQEIFQKNPLNPSSPNDKDYCEDAITKIAKSRGGFQMKYMTDADLRKCFPSSDSAWGAEANVYEFSRWSCDRVFGHASPSRWTETKSDSELINKIQSGEGCAVDQSVRGKPLRAVNCRSIQLSKYGEIPEHFGVDDKCFESADGKESVLYTLGEQEGSSNIYKINIGGNRRATSIYAIKRDDTNYLTASSKSCEELCGVKPGSSSKKLVLGDKTVFSAKDPKDKAGNEIVPYCTTVDTCRGWNANKQIIGSNGIVHKITYATTAGYSSKISDKDSTPCFYDNGKSVSVVSDSPSTREECCCINAKETKAVTHYYQPDDMDISDPGKFAHESDSVPEKPPQPKPKPAAEGEESAAAAESTESYSDMKWSYRYWKEKFEAKGADGTIHSEYNPKRYIEGKDLPACFGQNNIIYDGFSQADGKVLTVDPFKDHAAAVQCIHLAGISNRIQFIKNLMTSMSTCLIQVRTSGRADAGACKELFTQHLCGAVWQIVRAFIDGCTPIGAGIDFGKQDDDYGLEVVRAGLKGAYESVSDTQRQITSEYGNAKLNEILGTGEESIVRKICLGAFGYDWELNVRNLVDAAYATPFATLVQPVTKSREFLTVDPVSLKPKYEYRASWIINPGCDFERYDVYLACAGRKQLDQYPNSINCGALGAPSIGYTGALGTSTGYSQCDCINLPDEKIGPLVFSGKLKQNVLEDKVIPSGQRVQESNYRYDHLKFVLRPDRKITPKMKPNCFPQGYDDGVFYFPLIDKTARDILDCTADYVSGVFSCSGGSAFLSRKGTAELLEVTINGENANKVKELNIGDRLEVGARVVKTGKDKCLRISMPGDPIQPVYAGITLNGTNDIAPILLTGSLAIQGRTGQVIAPGITSSLLAQNNHDPVVINIQAVDNGKSPKPGNVKFYSEDDTLRIDGIEIKLDDEQPQGDSNTKIVVKSVNDKKIKKIITVEKEGAIIEIRDIQYTLPALQSGAQAEYGYSGSITINPQQQTSQSSQQKTVVVEMFHLKEDRDSYDNIPDNCDINDRIGEPKKYSILVSQSKGVDTSSLGPTIQTPTLNPRSPVEIGKQLAISARITHPSGVPEAKLSITKPDGTKDFEPQDMTKNGDVFEYVLGTDGMEKGKYRGNINAKSTNEKESNLAFSFDLKEPLPAK